MKKTGILAVLLLAAFGSAEAQFTRYLVKLKNKGGSPYTFNNPIAYLSQRSIDRRALYNIPIDSTDLPCTPAYINQIQAVPNVTVLNVSKWLNQVSILTTDPNAINTITALPFVQSVSGLAARPVNSGTPFIRNKFEMEQQTYPVPQYNTGRITKTTADYYNYGTNSFNEIHLHNGEFLHNIGLRGQGMLIGMLDGGYFNYTSLHAFDSAMANGQILSTWDFVAGNATVTDDITHGMQCLSTIVANIPGSFIGKAPKASFHLFRTEDAATEYPIEEHNWSCGAERSDSLGCNVISSSLGYNTFDNSSFDHTYAQMDGNTTMVTIAADLASKKGMIVFNANGNEGTNPWKFLIAPADGDSVVAVGAVTAAGVVGSFSSYGPSSNGRIKPDISSVGVNALLQGAGNTVVAGNGTSFACPNMAGLGTCLWQGFPEFNNMTIIRAMRQAGSIYATPNDRIGYGIPDMRKAFGILVTQYDTSHATLSTCNVNINWISKDVASMRYEVERKAPGDVAYTKVGDVPALTGNVLSNRTYNFSNDLVNVANGVVSYRIRQVLDTATANFYAVYVDTTSVVASGCTATGTSGVDPVKVQVTIHPNPVRESAVLTVETPDAVASLSIIVFDMKGRSVMRIQRSKASGKANFDLSVRNLQAGKYIIQVMNGNKPIGSAELLKL